MSKAVRCVLSLLVSLLLCSAMALAQAGGNNVHKDKDKNKSGEHHSRLAKVAFWRHRKDKNAKQAKPAQASSKQVQTKTAQIKSASPKQAAGRKDLKQEKYASNMNKPSAKKASVANKTKPGLQTQDPKTASLKQ